MYGPDLATHAVLRRNAWAFAQEEYELRTNPADLALVEAGTGNVVLAASVVDDATIAITRGDFRAKDGSRFQITDEGHLVVDTPSISNMQFSGNQFAGKLSLITITPMGLSVF